MTNLSNLGQPDEKYKERHGIVVYPDGQIAATFRLHFADKKVCTVGIFRNSDRMQQFFETSFCTDEDPDGAFATTATGRKWGCLIVTSLDRCNDSTVTHEITHACMEWMRVNGCSAEDLFARRPEEESPYEVFANEVGEMTKQFWECYTVSFERPAVWGIC